MNTPLRIIRAAAVAAAVGTLGYLTVTSVHQATQPIATAVPASNIGRVLAAASRQAAPDLSGATLTGASLDTASWKDHVIVVNFWGSWCTPCRVEASQLAHTANDTAGLGVKFVGVDVRDNPAAGLAFEREFGIPYPSFNDPNNALAARFGALIPVATPETFVFDTRGRVAAVFIGATTFNNLDPVIRQVVELG